MTAGDLWAKGRFEAEAEAVPGRGEAMSLLGVERWALGVEMFCDLVGVAMVGRQRDRDRDGEGWTHQEAWVREGECDSWFGQAMPMLC